MHARCDAGLVRARWLRRGRGCGLADGVRLKRMGTVRCSSSQVLIPRNRPQLDARNANVTDITAKGLAQLCTGSARHCRQLPERFAAFGAQGGERVIRTQRPCEGPSVFTTRADRAGDMRRGLSADRAPNQARSRGEAQAARGRRHPPLPAVLGAGPPGQ